jgi:hypothetical protein
VSYSHTFPTNHNRARCSSCHAELNEAWTCSSCHGDASNKHKEIAGFSNNCIACHPDGRKPRGNIAPAGAPSAAGLALAQPSANPVFTTIRALSDTLIDPTAAR